MQPQNGTAWLHSFLWDSQYLCLLFNECSCFSFSLEIGQNIHVKWENKTDEERSIAIEAAEEAVWKQATHVKEIALEKCRKLAEEELDKRMKEKDLECEKALKVF